MHNAPVAQHSYAAMPADRSALVDTYGRRITYVRMSITDRCDLRCVYCMAEEMTFLPRRELLTIEELIQLGKTFTGLGVTKLRITGGEPLIRGGVVQLLEQLGQLPLLQELCLTTNGTQLARYARSLADAGVDRINVSLDSINPQRFRQLTRVGDVAQVLEGIRAAQHAGFKKIKINCVALKNFNAQEVPDLVRFALDEGLDISFIEEMPLGNIHSHGRAAEFISSQGLRDLIEPHFPLEATTESTDGPARYWRVAGYDSRIGFISPHSQNFCSSCNRVRVTATGRMLLCLGQENSVDLRAALRESPEDATQLRAKIIDAMSHKPLQHDFTLTEAPQILRFMNATGG